MNLFNFLFYSFLQIKSILTICIYEGRMNYEDITTLFLKMLPKISVLLYVCIYINSAFCLEKKRIYFHFYPPTAVKFIRIFKSIRSWTNLHEEQCNIYHRLTISFCCFFFCNHFLEISRLYRAFIFINDTFFVPFFTISTLVLWIEQTNQKSFRLTEKISHILTKDGKHYYF